MIKMSTGSMEASPSPSPGYNGALNINLGVPKIGTLVPNRVFVGGISSNTTESELHQLFSEFGNVKQTKIIADRAGVSKGYGFVTFETEEEARRLQAASDDIILKERKLNIAPAIKKQQAYGRSYEMGQPVVNGAIYYHNGIPYTYQQNGVAMFVTDGQPYVGGVVSPTTGKGASTPLSLVYPGTGGTMFLPTPAPNIPSHHQIQFQAANALREAVQSQAGSGATTGGVGGGAAPAWRWISPTTTAAGSTATCNNQQQPATAATSPIQSTPPNTLNQPLNYSQESSGGDNSSNKNNNNNNRIMQPFSNQQQQPSLTSMADHQPDAAPHPLHLVSAPTRPPPPMVNVMPNQNIQPSCLPDEEPKTPGMFPVYVYPSPTTPARCHPPPPPALVDAKLDQHNTNQISPSLPVFIFPQQQQGPNLYQQGPNPNKQCPNPNRQGQNPNKHSPDPNKPGPDHSKQDANVNNNNNASNFNTGNPIYVYPSQNGGTMYFSYIAAPPLFLAAPPEDIMANQENLKPDDGGYLSCDVMADVTKKPREPGVGGDFPLTTAVQPPHPTTGPPVPPSPYLVQIMAPGYAPQGGAGADGGSPATFPPVYNCPPPTPSCATAAATANNCGNPAEATGLLSSVSQAATSSFSLTPAYTPSLIPGLATPQELYYANYATGDTPGGQVFFPSYANPPNTPITPSIEPSQGSKTGYIVPSPNMMTNSQFFHSYQSPGSQQQPVAGGAGGGGREVVQQPEESKGDSILGGELVEVKSRPSHHQPLFNSPFKRYIPFEGKPTLQRFPLQDVPSGRYSKNSVRGYHLGQQRLVGGRGRGGRPGLPPRLSPISARQAQPRFRRNSDTKVGFYKAGDRWGQKTQEMDSAATTTSNGGGVRKQTPPPPLTSGQANALTSSPTGKRGKIPSLLSDEPDLLQGKMKRLQL